jgi:hypothetical protein
LRSKTANSATSGGLFHEFREDFGQCIERILKMPSAVSWHFRALILIFSSQVSKNMPLTANQSACHQIGNVSVY